MNFRTKTKIVEKSRHMKFTNTSSRKQLLIDTIPFVTKASRLNESINSTDYNYKYNDNGNLIVTGLLQRANAKNKNGRIYPFDVLKEECDKYIKERINQNNALGELDHPDRDEIDENNVSHNIIKLWWVGNDVYGDVEITDTPAGNVLKALFLSNIQVGISSRGVGTTSKNAKGETVVNNDFELICWDFVSNPSTYGAYMTPMLTEAISTYNKFEHIDKTLNEIICEMTGVCKICK